MSNQSRDDENTTLDELNEDGAGGTVGEDSAFEPEEDEEVESEDS
ncbi:hypothetical protein [Mobilicoccus massiliensis]|nr:hypothetical protein [Mobilicoccus massiliensis]